MALGPLEGPSSNIGQGDTQARKAVEAAGPSPPGSTNVVDDEDAQVPAADTPADAPTDAPIDTPSANPAAAVPTAEGPADAPANVPTADAPPDALADAPSANPAAAVPTADAPPDAPIDTPSANPAAALPAAAVPTAGGPADAPADSPADAPADASSANPPAAAPTANAPPDAPADAPADAPSGNPAAAVPTADGPADATADAPARTDEGDHEDAQVRKTVEAAELKLSGSTMTEWQRAWCTKDKVLTYLRGRKGDVLKAADLLAQALEWRQAQAEVLQGMRVPKWTGDLRVLAQGSAGNPVVYACILNKRPSCPTDEVDHIAAVLEASVRAMPPGVTQVDAVIDAYGFRLKNFLDVRPVIALATALRHAYRDILRTGVIVDAPRTFSVLWKVFEPLLPASTRDKIRFVSKSEALQLVGDIAGADVVTVLDGVMAGNRSDTGAPPPKMPSEIA